MTKREKEKKGEKTENKGKIKQRKDKTRTMNTKRGIISEKSMPFNVFCFV